MAHASFSSEDANPEAQWFGFRQVSASEKTQRVREVFLSVAQKYDLMNDLMSGGLHRLWKNHLVDLMRPRAGQRILDLAGGTGDIALRCAARSKGKAALTVCDINPAMMQVGRAKAIDQGWLDEIQWVNGNAEALPFASGSFDTAVIAFGLRNVTHIDTALAEIYRTLRPGGRFFCLEFSPGVAPGLRVLYENYCEKVLPALGAMVAKDEESYRYLAESIQKFPPQEELAARMGKAGFARARYQNMMGGIAVLHQGWRF